MADKTIKQLADELGVSKTAIRNNMDDAFRANYTAKNSKGVITITPQGCKLIAETFAKSAQTDRKEFAETELLTIPRSVWALMEKQLEEKDRQIQEKDKQIADLTEAVKSQAQSINADRHNSLAGTLQQQLIEGTVEEEQAGKRKKRFWPF